MQYLLVICVLFYLMSGHGCQMPETRQSAKQSGGHFKAETNARDAFWNNYWHNQNVDRVNQQKASRDLFRQQTLNAEYKARQMVIDKALQRFQQSLDNPEPKKKWWQK